MEEPDFPYPIQKYSGKAKWVTLFIGAVLLVTAIAVWAPFTRQKQDKTKGLEVKKALAVEYKQLSNSPTSKPEKDKKDVTINILNGTGVTGQAGKIVKALVESGYSLSNIKLGNAEEFTHIGTTITANADFEKTVANIKDVIKPVFPEIADGIPNNNPNVDSGFDVVIITGSRVTNTIAPTQEIARP